MDSIESGSRFCNFLKNIVKTMSSSSVHVREIRNDGGEEVLHFTIDANGIDVQPQVDGDLPKDHTYNKDPSIIDQGYDKEGGDANLKDAGSSKQESPKRAGRGPRAGKSKLAPPRVQDKSKSPAKKEPMKKNARKTPLSKSNTKTEQEPVKEEPERSKEYPEKKATVDAESSTKSNRGRKRKLEVIEEELESKVAKDELAKKEVAESKKEKSPEKEDKKSPAKDEKKSPEKEIEAPGRRGRSLAIIKSLQKKNVPVKSTKKQSPPPKVMAAAKPKSATVKKEDTGDQMADLPKGWTRKIVERKSGKTAGAFDIYIYSPDGTKLRSRPDVASYLAKIKSNLKLEDFNFTRRGVTVPGSKKSPEKKESPKALKKKVGTATPKRFVVKIQGPSKKTLTNNAQIDEGKKSPKKNVGRPKRK